MTALIHKIPAAFHDEADGNDYALGTQWWYRSDDPAAIIVRCPRPHGEVVEWLFARETLAHGLHAPAGQSTTFHVEPCGTGAHLNLTANFDADLITIAFPHHLVEAFLVATIELCPLGEVAETEGYVAELAKGVEEVLNEWPR